MAFVSDITLSAVIKREKFTKVEEVRNYFADKYPNLKLDEESLEFYFPKKDEETRGIKSSLRANMTSEEESILTRKRRLIILSEYLKNELSYHQLVPYLQRKYPDISFTIHIVRSCLNPDDYSPGVTQKILQKREKIRRKVTLGSQKK